MWSGLYIAPNGGVRMCCSSLEMYQDKEILIDDIDDLQEYFNSDRLVDRRKEDVYNEDLCKSCKLKESAGAPSLRTMIKDTYKRMDIVPRTNPDDCLIEHLDISFSNVCNQKCLMCRSEFSSQWYTTDAMIANSENDLGFNRIPIKYRKWTSEHNMEKIKNILPGLKHFSIKGGEPLIQQEVIDILEYIWKNDYDMNINIVSNFQNVDKDVLDLLASLENLQLTISIDSTGQRYNWIRGGNFDQTIENVQRFVEKCSHDPEFGYANTLNCWSLPYLVEDIKRMEELNAKIIGNRNILPWYNILSVMGPKYTSPFILPRTERIKYVHEFEKNFGMIVEETDWSKKYKSLNMNHMETITALETDMFEVSEEDLKRSEQWKQFITGMRKIETPL
jgi:hypothetical protein